MGAEHPILAHSDFEANDCCGCLAPVIPDEQAEITGNEWRGGEAGTCPTRGKPCFNWLLTKSTATYFWPANLVAASHTSLISPMRLLIKVAVLPSLPRR